VCSGKTNEWYRKVKGKGKRVKLKVKVKVKMKMLAGESDGSEG